ncbi:MAG TPA: methionine--tRNA ligase [Thermoguttaceae bacterium]|nr:methionine--tRNA ligase [Thermoguttaceae bacterium]
MKQRRILVTSALPYANGHIHIGHLVEYLQTDMWVRFQKLRGHRCIYLCADDTHGTAIMMSAAQQGTSEAAFIARMREAHVRDFAGFHIEFDHYGSTNSPENRAQCAEIWAAIRKAGLVVEKEVTQLYDAQAGTFLADRQVKGTCPQCRAPGQYGDNCDKCGATYGPSDLIDPVSAFTGATPEVRSARHLFIQIERLHEFLAEWTQSGDHLQTEVANYLAGHFLHEPLRDWDISRPAPYFGFEIPDSPGNYWYVWFDAPIGYMASTRQWCDRHGEKFDDWWRDERTEIHHFIGKDITYFHTLFWPAMLKTAGFTLPTKVHIHGFLTVGGEKMSKSKGTFIRAATYLEHLDPSYLRYYYASKLGPRVDDLDLNLDEFLTKVNSDLVGKVVNLASRTAKFVEKTGLSGTYPDDGGLFRQAADEGRAIAESYEQGDTNRAMRQIMAIADRANQFIEHAQPWTLAKDPAKARQLQDICTIGLNLFRQIAVYMAPVLPRLAQQTGELLGRPIQHWDESRTPLVGTAVNKFTHMMTRVDKKQVDAMIEASRESQAEVAPSTAGESALSGDSPQPLADEPLADVCSYDDFLKVDLRVARVVEAEHVPGADKLLHLTLSLGGDKRLNVFAGIKAAYEPEKLVGRLVLCVANLAPRKMKFGVSEGMILASGSGGKDIYLFSPDEGAQPGQRVH